MVGGIEQVIQPVQNGTRVLYTFFSPTSSQIQKLRDENEQLRRQLVDQKELLKENAALQDQFSETIVTPSQLVTAKIIGLQSFLPGVTTVDEVIVDKGSSDGIAKNMVVITKNMVFGKVADVSAHRARIAVLTNTKIRVAGKTSNTNALGIIKGNGNSTLLLENVILSDKLAVGDTVVTKGDIDGRGYGFPPGLVIGKILSVDKKASSLFQTAQVEFPIDSTRLSTIFILKP